MFSLTKKFSYRFETLYTIKIIFERDDIVSKNGFSIVFRLLNNVEFVTKYELFDPNSIFPLVCPHLNLCYVQLYLNEPSIAIQCSS